MRKHIALNLLLVLTTLFSLHAEETIQPQSPQEESIALSTSCEPVCVEEYEFFCVRTWCEDWYLGVKGAVNIIDIKQVRHTKTHARPGAMMTVALGHPLACHFRAEAELGCRYNRYRDTKYDGVRKKLRGYIKTFTLMGNLYYDFPEMCEVTPYLGAGVGYGYEMNKEKRVKTQRHYHSKIAYQGIAGFVFPAAECLDLGLEYRYFYINDRMHVQNFGVVMQYYF